MTLSTMEGCSDVSNGKRSELKIFNQSSLICLYQKQFLFTPDGCTWFCLEKKKWNCEINNWFVESYDKVMRQFEGTKWMAALGQIWNIINIFMKTLSC